MLDQDEINKLMAQANELEEDEPEQEEVSQASGDDQVLSDDDIAALVASTASEEPPVEEEPQSSPQPQTKEEPIKHELGSESWVEKKIKDSHLPYPIEPEHKVVDQLSQVTEDGEIKAGEVFDAMLESTDKLAHIDSVLADLNGRCEGMEKFVFALQKKFPNIDIFAQKAEDISYMKQALSDLKDDSSNATTSLYKAMETMQYQDISRQKIERVINVVRKLSEYLNNVFDDKSYKKEVKIAKHIHGDDTERDALASEEDINSMIEQYTKLEME